MRAVMYLRVSGPSQLLGDGFERQRIACQAYARANNIQIVGEFQERAVPGKTELDNRPALLELLASDVQLVLIEKLDRLARDLMVQETIIADLRKRGIDLISALEPDLLQNDPTRILMRQIFGAIAQYEKTMIVLKLRSSRDRARARGERASGQPHYGTAPKRATAAQMAAAEHESAAASRMRELRDQGQSYRQIANTMTQEQWRPRLSDKWHVSSIRLICRRGT